MKYAFTLLNVMITACMAWGQYDNIWTFGDHAGIEFSDGSAKAIQTGINTREGAASLCDSIGNLLFYTDGTDVWNKNHPLMPNGTMITGPTIGNVSITNSTSQGALIAPVPGDKHKYYVFSLGAKEGAPTYGALFYTIVDVRLNNGLGDVVPGKKGIKFAGNFTEHMTAVSGNHCNIYLVLVNRFKDSFCV